MTTRTQERTHNVIDRGEWLQRLLVDVQENEAYRPSPKALLRMRTRIFEGMAEPVRAAA
jgi:hypothetical protein